MPSPYRPHLHRRQISENVGKTGAQHRDSFARLYHRATKIQRAKWKTR